MTELVRPDLRLRSSWIDAVAEFEAAGSTMHGSGLWDFEPLDLSAAAAPGVVAHLLAYADPGSELPADRVHCTYFWIVDDSGDEEEFVGYLALRHSLTPWLLEEGGHIGYSVRPSRRREGHASRALAMAVRRAAGLGLDRVLVTCEEDNVGSRRTIEGAGASYEDSRNGRRRYWIATTGEQPAGHARAEASTRLA